MSPRASGQPKLGSVFKAQDEKKLGAAFMEAREPLPQIIILHPLGPFRDVITKHGWPKIEPDINRAQAEAIRAGDLDISEIEKRYGKGSWESTPMIIYPPYAGEEAGREVIQVQNVGNVVKLVPGGSVDG